MRIRSVGEETGVFDLIELVYAIGENLVLDVFEIVADNYCFEFDAETVGKYTAFGEKFKAYVCDFAFVIFAVNDKIIFVCHNF